MSYNEILRELGGLKTELYERDFLAAADKTDQELGAVFATADALRMLREHNYAARIFQTGLALWEGSPADWGYPAFLAACELLGLRAVCVERVTGEELVGAMPDVLAGADRERCRGMAAMAEGIFRGGILQQRPVTVHPELALGAALRLIRQFGGVEHLRGKTLAVLAGEGETLGHPAETGGQVAELCARFGMDLRCWGDLPEETLERARENAERTGGSFTCPESREAALEGAELVWPFPDGAVVSLAELWAERGQMPYVTAAAILLAKVPDPAKVLAELRRQSVPRRLV